MSGRSLKGATGTHEVEARLEGARLTLRCGEDETRVFEVEALRDGSWLMRDGHVVRHVHVARSGSTWWVHDGGRTHVLEEVLARGSGATAEGSLVAPMTGTVQEVLVSVGDGVEKGQALVVLSAMKMQVEIKSPHAGTVTGLPHGVGDQVDGGEAVAVVEAGE
jgi:biotin carboxyl carrier protein